MKSEGTLAVDKQLHEIKPHGTALFSFATYRMINPSDTLFVTSHWHREVEILCFQKGCAQVLLSGREYPVKAGDILFVNQGELHQISSTDPGLLYHACDFPLDFLCFAGYDYAQSNYLDPLSDKELFFPTLLSHDSPVGWKGERTRLFPYTRSFWISLKLLTGNCPDMNCGSRLPF